MIRFGGAFQGVGPQPIFIFPLFVPRNGIGRTKMPFSDIARGISSLVKIIGQGFMFWPQGDPVTVDPRVGGVFSGLEGCPGWGAYRLAGKGVKTMGASQSQTVKIRR
jgi:hypothetical protein